VERSEEMKTELLIAALWNLKCGLAVLSGLAAVAVLMAVIISYSESNDSWGGEKKKGPFLYQRLLRKRILLPIGMGLLFSTVPSMEDVWRVRISLIKLELASPENIRAGADTIARIAKKLEEKYLSD